VLCTSPRSTQADYFRALEREMHVGQQDLLDSVRLLQSLRSTWSIRLFVGVGQQDLLDSVRRLQSLQSLWSVRLFVDVDRQDLLD
jgi:hypothetical protein